jgi:fatty acid desaturase (delta-4 desaturase)
VALRPLALARRSAAARVATRVDAVATPVRFAEPDPVVAPRPDSAMPSMEDPWTDPKWRDVKWTVYRDVAYDMQPFVDKHPGGNWLLNLSIQRDCTALIESYHLRPEVSEARFKGLPVLEDFPVNAVPKSPRPNDSELYNAIRTRVRKELFPQEGKAMHRQGGDFAAATIIGTAVACYAAYASVPGILTGAFLGLAGAWIGLTIQHCGNHGAMSPKVWVNNALGLTDDLIGGSSLMWRYHHQVSHHIHCNDNALDQDVHTAMPLLRFDARQPKKWFHKFQHLYLFLAFPLMQVAFQVGDITGLITKDCEGAKLHGATALELSTVVLGKMAHFGLLLGPALAHGWAAVGAGVAAFVAVQGMVLGVHVRGVAQRGGGEDPAGHGRRGVGAGLGRAAAGDFGGLGREGWELLHRGAQPAGGAPSVPRHLLRALPRDREDRQGGGGQVWRAVLVLPHAARHLRRVHEVRQGDGHGGADWEREHRRGEARQQEAVSHRRVQLSRRARRRSRTATHARRGPTRTRRGNGTSAP